MINRVASYLHAFSRQEVFSDDVVSHSLEKADGKMECHEL